MPRLIEGAVPSFLLGCPAYLSLYESDWMGHEEKAKAKEKQQFAKAMEESLVDFNLLTEKQKCSLLDLKEKVTSKWELLEKEDCFYFNKFVCDEFQGPSVKSSITVQSDMNACAFMNNVKKVRAVNINYITTVLGSCVLFQTSRDQFVRERLRWNQPWKGSQMKASLS